MAHSAEYEATLKSERWKAFSRQIRNGGRCEACRRDCFGPGHLHTHHWHYESLGAEDVDDVSALCFLCHEYADGLRKRVVRIAKVTAKWRDDPDWRKYAKHGGLALLRVRRGFLDARDGKAAWAFMVEVALDARAKGEI